MAGAVFVNPKSGPSETSVEELQLRFPGHSVAAVEPTELASAVRHAVSQRVDFVAVAGGDGTIRCAAQELIGSTVPLLPIPAGTRNHFAKDVGIADLDAVAEALHGVLRLVDIGRVNGKCFVNNSSIGLYPRMVEAREKDQRRRRRKLPKSLATLIAAYDQLLHGRKIDVHMAGETHRAWMVFLGNGVYGHGLSDIMERSALNEHKLDVRIVKADRRLARLRVVGAMLFGRVAESPLVVLKSMASVTLRLSRHRARVALDGEVEIMHTPLVYECLPDALSIMVPDTTSTGEAATGIVGTSAQTFRSARDRE